ncbi:hypothetical protein [Nocardia implantans]|uniref:Uncharacterized protein n=1 Tax=Nocardia implantans TaxID=3108168 RepID=A0ABU6AZ06_9NOCA|nr:MULTISPECIES: hypothetical protein [unclassified Nocardia]MBF6194387.1 hypothetical protein [Nocardia beijingensis]MEA3529995.1 hypothetical protein [Nocardia sp. CDC192]MEB3512527.1 hypothetical protein [Nocardia sp. CDC186]
MSIDPTDVRIRTGDGTRLPELTEDALGELLGEPAGPEHAVLELSRADLHEIRAGLLPDGVYELEHRAGSATESFQMYTSDPVLVRDVLWAWLSGDPWWRDAVAWFRVDPAIAELRAVQDELAGLLDGLTGLDDLTAGMDAALARADELLALPPDGEGPDQP